MIDISKKICVVSDIHCGADTAICIPNFEVNSEREEISTVIKANKTQEKLYEEWQNMIDDMGRVDYVFDLAENIEGTNYKGAGLGCLKNDIAWQEDMAIELLKMIKSRKYVGVQGSGYHSNTQGSSDLAVIKSLAQTYHEKCIFDDAVIFDVENVKFHLRHVTSFTQIPELSQQALKRDVLQALNEGKKTGKIDCFLRGHTHRYATLDFTPYFTAHVSPCWKIPDQFIRQRSMHSTDIGYLEINVNGSEHEVIPHILDI